MAWGTMMSLKRYLYSIVTLIIFLLIWWFASTFYQERFFPSPLLVGTYLVEILKGSSALPPGSYYHYLVTLKRVLLGVGIGFLMGTSIGILMGISTKLFDFFESWCWVANTTPAIMWAYILILALGATETTAIGVLAALVFPRVAFNVAEGVKAVRRELLEMAKSFGASLRHIVRDIYIPHLTPYLLSGARTGFAIGIKVIAIAEMVGINSGVGYMINYWWGEFFLAPIISWGLLLVFTGIIVEFGFFRLLEKSWLVWLRK
jgi:NitT/TauT family transport system permease protein